MLEPGLLYFAYGCNMDRDVLSGVLKRSPGKSHAARADGYRLRFNTAGGEGADGGGVTANLVEDAACSAYGVVYSLPKGSVGALDTFEGVPEQYRRETIWIQPVGRQARQAALVYLGQPAYLVPDGRPDPGYLETLLRGAAEHRLPGDYIEWLERLGRGEESTVDRYPSRPINGQ